MFSRRYFPQVGGVEKHVSEVAEGLLKRGVKVEVICEKRGEFTKDIEIIDNVIVRRISYPKIKYLGLAVIWTKIWKLRKVIKSSDLVHVHDVFIWYLPYRIMFPGKRVYVTFHGWEGVYPIGWMSILQKRLAAKLGWGNICVGFYIEKYFGITADKIVYGGVEKSNKKAIRKKNKIVYVGRLDKDTGLKVFLKVLEKVRKYEVDFCGEGELRKECEKYGKVHGYCDPRAYLREARVCWGAGYLSILEAMAEKCLVMVGYENLLKKDYYRQTPFREWLVCGDDPNKLAEAIKGAMEMKKEYKNKIEEGYGWARKQDWGKVVEDYWELWGGKQ